MKRLFFLHKSLLVAPVLAGLLFTATSFSYGPAGDAKLVGDPPQEKEQRVKVIVSTDGKVTKIDTTFNLPDMKIIQFKIDSLLEKMGIAGVEAGKMARLVQQAEKRIKWMEMEDKNFPGILPPPPPPMPPHPPVIIRKMFGSDPFAFDSKDPSIISYDKKNIGKGLEKITIIRKKQAGQPQEKMVEVSVETSDDPNK